jgi:hypothetical protein
MVPQAMRADIMRFYGQVNPAQARNKKERKQLEKVAKELPMLSSERIAEF